MTAMEKLKLPTVLVVDDEVRSLEALRRTLEEDFEVFHRFERRRGANGDGA